MTKHAAGFSLIEILIAVLILALGLLGLGAVFPVVIREQRTAQDRIGGATATNNIRAFLNSSKGLRPRTEPFFFEPSNPDGTTGQFQNVRVVADYSGWHFFAETWKYHTWVSLWRESLLNNPNANMPAGPDFDFSPDGLWETDLDWNGMSGVMDEYRDTGNLQFPMNPPSPLTGDQARDAMPLRIAGELNVVRNFPAFNPITSDPTYEVRFSRALLPLADRLNPAGADDAANPFLVWDLAVRRLNPESTLRNRFAGSGGAGLESAAERLTPFATTLQVAVFVRRVDSGIRTGMKPGTNPPRSYTLRETFLDTGLTGANRRLPVGEETNAVAANSLPTGNGTDGRNGVRYSAVRKVPASFDLTGPANTSNATRRDTLVVPASISAANWSLIRQNGQKVVDNLGNIYTVIGSRLDGGVRTLKVDPPVPVSVIETAQANNTPTGPDYTVNAIRELIFSPQVPVSVFVMEVIP